ncbi:hypothetical protein NDU88_000008 [Pleurodeles waltl]|uniref:Uncharacterized protein n=1 Tax=Pleurodeles waltl TaxID=8319 RepID=A0AAV7NEU8_PLEWA|nr:hypothetical protein NDU88_000008 [Pleurodeles waltl]
MAQIGLRRFFCLSLTCPIFGRPNAIFPYAGAAWCTSFFLTHTGQRRSANAGYRHSINTAPAWRFRMALAGAHFFDASKSINTGPGAMCVKIKAINTTFITIAGVLADLLNTRRDTVVHQRAPDTSLDDEQPSTSASASGQETPPQEQQDTSTPPPADEEPARKWSLRSRNKTENIAKTATRK